MQELRISNLKISVFIEFQGFCRTFQKKNLIPGVCSTVLTLSLNGIEVNCFRTRGFDEKKTKNISEMNRHPTVNSRANISYLRVVK